MAYVDPHNSSYGKDEPLDKAAPLVGPTITITNNGQAPYGQNSQLVSVRLENDLPPEPFPATAGAVTHGHVNDNPHGFYTTNL
ncbi:MAG: hypothetical protein ACKPAC_16835, partial [Alphaproteobacteria bacterium]